MDMIPWLFRPTSAIVIIIMVGRGTSPARVMALVVAALDKMVVAVAAVVVNGWCDDDTGRDTLIIIVCRVDDNIRVDSILLFSLSNSQAL